MIGRDKNKVEALPLEQTLEILKKHHVLKP
jgi:hypothetical protein